MAWRYRVAVDGSRCADVAGVLLESLEQEQRSVMREGSPVSESGRAGVESLLQVAHPVPQANSASHAAHAEASRSQ